MHPHKGKCSHIHIKCTQNELPSFFFANSLLIRTLPNGSLRLPLPQANETRSDELSNNLFLFSQDFTIACWRVVSSYASYQLLHLTSLSSYSLYPSRGEGNSQKGTLGSSTRMHQCTPCLNNEVREAFSEVMMDPTQVDIRSNLVDMQRRWSTIEDRQIGIPKSGAISPQTVGRGTWEHNSLKSDTQVKKGTSLATGGFGGGAIFQGGEDVFSRQHIGLRARAH